jgi:hypothetical protein
VSEQRDVTAQEFTIEEVPFDPLKNRLEAIYEAIRSERLCATGTAEHNDARSALYRFLPEHPNNV